jgi:hypothetical protein
LIRQRWLDSIAAVPPIILIFVFKIWISRTTEQKFRFYEPTPQEAEAERYAAASEKRTKHSEMEKRFLHPALQQDKLYQVMVHKSQEQLAREVLSAYPWFAGKHDMDGEGVQIKAVREVSCAFGIKENVVDDYAGEPRIRSAARWTSRRGPPGRVGCQVYRVH